MIKNLFTDIRELDRSTLGVSEVIDTIHSKYRLQMSTPKIDSLSSQQAEAYEVEDIVSNSLDLYALLFRKNLPVRYQEICSLQATFIQNFAIPIDCGITNISSQQAERFCVIMKKPAGKTLKSYIEEKRQFSHNFCIENIALPISKILLQLHQCGITHGCINPGNIYIDEEDNITLGNCISEVCGLSQPTFYETISRGQCHPYGKGIPDPSIDYYALGMTIFAVVTGNTYNSHDRIALLNDKLQSGTYGFLNNLYLVNGILGDLIRGLVIDDKSLRWSAEQIDAIAHGRDYIVSNLIEKSFLSRPILFKEKEIYSKISLAHELSIHWEDAKLFIHSEAINKWLDIRTNEQKLLEELENLKASSKKRNSAQQLFSKDDDLVMKAILLLDPDGPIRYKNIAFYKESTGDMLAAGMAFGYADVTQFIANALFANFFAYYTQLYEIYQDHQYVADKYLFERSSESIKRAGYGYGIERCLYDLCEDLPCQSHIFTSTMIFSSKEALLYLENNNVKVEDILSKKTLLCFIASKLRVPGELKIEHLKDYPALQKNKELFSLYLLANTQLYAKIDSLPNLTAAYASAVSPILNNFLKSQSIKKMVNSAIDESIVTGDLTRLLQNATNITLLAQDAEGFMKALRRTVVINSMLQQFSQSNAADARAKQLGLSTAVRISYLLTCASVIFSFFKNF